MVDRMNRIFNFSAGPSMLPLDVLKQAQEELCNWNGLGTSIMEINHRNKFFIQVAEEAKEDFSNLLNVPKNYKILFCLGGGRSQFSALPLNLLGNKNNADYVDTGYWSLVASKEAKKFCKPNIINVKSTINGFKAVKPMNQWKLSNSAAYAHYCPNETIDGISIYETPNFKKEIVVVADFSSIILSSPIDISSYGLIYAGAQKNIGPSGFTVVIIHEDLLGKSKNICPSVLDYTIINQNNSLFNTPPTFAWYIAGLVFKWLKRQGGLSAIDIINKKKSTLLYSVIDNSNLYHNNVAISNRSRTNVPFQLVNSNLETLFLRESFKAGLCFLEGHRSVGGIRASIYNSMPFEGVKALTDFMIEFERCYG